MPFRARDSFGRSREPKGSSLMIKLIRPVKSRLTKATTGSALLTVEQVAARWQISERQVRRFIAHSDLRAHKIGRVIRISEADIELFELRCR